MLRTLLLCILEEKSNRRSQVGIQAFRTNISAIVRRRRDRRISRPALPDSGSSLFMTLFLSGNDQALFTFTGFDH